VTFSQPYAQDLGLDWKKAYEEMLEGLNVKLIRIPVYWNRVQPSPDRLEFADLDWQLDQAASHDAKVVLSIGRRVPRWPECHEPEWLKELPSEGASGRALLSFMETLVRKYQNHPAVFMWQVENEPFLGSFGQCPELDKDFFDSEIALVKKLDPSKPILITDSGELSLWTEAGKRGDLFGTTLYRFVFSDIFKRYWVNYIPSWFYRAKAGLVRALNPGKPVIIAELQAEPWTTRGILNTPIEEQFKTMSMKKFESILGVARATGFTPQYLWGVEWWYWMKQNNHPEFWEKAQTLFN
jgi:hypothetical protein